MGEREAKYSTLERIASSMGVCEEAILLRLQLGVEVKSGRRRAKATTYPRSIRRE